MIRNGRWPRVSAAADAVLSGFAVLLLVLMFAIVLQVVCSFFDINPVVTFQSVWPLVGDAVTLNSLLDVQWHLLAIISLLPCALVWLRDGHVRVDFLYNQFSPLGRSRVDVLGNLVFALPWLLLCIPASYHFALRALSSAEQSRNGGLNDLYLIKAALPLGFALLLVAVLIDSALRLRELTR